MMLCIGIGIGISIGIGIGIRKISVGLRKLVVSEVEIRRNDEARAHATKEAGGMGGMRGLGGAQQCVRGVRGSMDDAMPL